MNETIQNDQTSRLNLQFFQKKASDNYHFATSSLKKIIKTFFIFNISFFSLFIIELFLFLSFLMASGPTMALSFIIAGFFLSSFVYLLLFYYFQSKKKEQLYNLNNNFILSCKKSLLLPEGTPQHHLTIALAASKLSESVDSVKKSFEWIKKIKRLNSLLIEEDVFKFKESLLLSAIDEHLTLIKISPTDLELHSSLASTYTGLSKLYMDAKDDIFIPKTKQDFFKKKYESCILNAIEEFRVLNDYAPNDTWIHLQLAQNFGKLNMLNDQIKEYELIYKLRPKDNNILFNLGKLYFMSQRSSKGLRIYEELLSRSFKDADLLLNYYGIYKSQKILEDF